MGLIDQLRADVYESRLREKLHYGLWVSFTFWSAVFEAASLTSWPHPAVTDIGLTAITAAAGSLEFINATKSTAKRSELEQRLDAADKGPPWLWDNQKGE